MKKFTLFLFATLFSALSFAALNPYAYGLSSTLDGATLKVNYSLNAPATAVNVVIMDGETEVKTIDCDGTTKGSHFVEISTLDLPTGKSLTWKVVVTGTSVTKPTLQDGLTLKYCLPRGIGVDRAPESPYFGRVYTTDATGGSGYHASEGKGLYVFDAALNPIKNSTDGYKFTGGITFGTDDIGRVEVSDDGRVFLSRLNTTSSPVLEINPANLNENFKNVFTSITGSAIGIDVKGAGESLQLIMLSKTSRNITEYDLKTATQWTSSTPSRTYTKKDLTTEKALSLVTDNAYISYDLNDGVWLTQHRATATTTEPTIAHVIPSGMDYNNFNAGLSHNGTSNGGIAISPDGKLLAVVGAGTKKLTIYSVSRDNGDIALTSKYTISTSGSNHTALEWDYAGNLYVANRSAETITFYAMPYDGEVTTPAPSKYAFEIYTLTSFSNDENKGAVIGAGTYGKGETATLTATPKEGYKLLYWSDRSTENPRTITMNKNEAISAYFVKVYDQEPTFTITKVWENTNVPAATGDGFQAVGWDGNIYMQNKTAGKIQVFSNGTNAATDYATSNTSGQQIAVDEAGNMIVFNAYFATGTPNAIQIFKKGSTTAKAVTFTLKDPARCDFFSASGDIYSAEGGYVYFYCAGKTVINRLKITNGAATAADVTTDVVGEAVYSSPQNTNYVMVDIFGNLVAHARSNAINAINVYTNESKAFTLPSIKMGTLGGCSFELGGKELWAYHAGASNYSSEWNIYNMTDSKFLSDDDFYAVDKEATTNYACNWLNVQVVDEYTAYIYQFCPKKAVALWKVTMQAGKATYTVTANATNGSVTGAGTYEEGATATLTATPAEHYRFVNWTKGEEVVSIETTYSFVVTEDVTLTANFEAIPQYAITVESSNAEQGSVTGGGSYYEGEEVTIKATAVGGFVFEKWSDDNTDNPRTITVSEAATYTAIFKLAPARVFAYNLDVVDNGNDTYTLSFIPNTNAVSGRVILYNGDTKAQIHEETIAGAIVKGVKSEVVISKSLLPATGNVTWAVELTGEQVDKLTLLTKANDKANYGFNRPQGVAIDNNPASDFFGRIYIALPKAGGTGYTDTNYGIVVMDPQHKRLKSGVVANGDALGANGRYSMHRVAVNPTNGHVYYVRTSDSNEGVTGTAIYELTPDATNILTDGGTAKNVISDASDITNANSVCFDENGVMYVVANANYTNAEGSTGRVYKVVDGVATLVTQTSREIASKDNAIVPDGKGGFWIAQHRNNLDGFNHLLHIDASGNANYTIDNATNTHLLPVQTYTKSGTTYNNASYRGQVAYYSIDENNGLVAYGGGAKVSVFKATYDGSGVPTLESWQTISLLSSSSTEGINVDGIAFDYAGNIIVMSATDERMYQYALPIESANTSLVPSPTSKTIKLGTLYNVEVAVNDNAMGTATGAGEYVEGETATVTATANADYRFVNWTKGAEVVSTDATYSFTVTENTTLIANFEPLPEIAYDLNGGVWNKYGWTSKKDMYNALLDDWRAYSGSARPNVSYDAQLGVGNSSKGIPTTITSVDDRVALMELFNDPAYANKWGWLATYVDAVAATQYKKMDAAQGVKTQPTSGAGVLVYTLGNFFGEDKAHSTDYIDAVDFTGVEAYAEAFQPTWGQSLPNPTQPTTNVVLGNPYKENYRFEGWYAEEDFSGTPVTTVDQNTDGTLYAKWIEHFHTREVPAGYYATVCLPYNLIDVDGAILYEVAGKDNGKVYLDEVPASETEAGKPYIFFTEAATQVFYYGDTETTVAGNQKSLYGTFVKLEDADLVGMYMLQSNKVVKCADTGCWIDPYRAYFNGTELEALGKPGAQMPGRRRVSLGATEENTTTGSEDIVTPNEQVIKVIENGQVIIIRDGVKYNVQGVRL